ncbi:MAG: energy-coupling factor ABC transporter permease [Burkholderiaceae bacterium]|nr:energy-coupling factor ABC transporter permease [Burkholderiaceae bacterium]
MHMADALLSPAVGATMWLASAAALAYSARRVREQGEDRLVPLMGVLGAFVFAAQMINFAIPGTGSSGHLGGGLLLAALLGPHAALIVIASVLTVQALFFADGGLLALGANIFNLGVLPCFVAYPLLYRSIVGAGASRRRISAGAVVAALAGLQLGALGVVLQTVGSGISSLPLSSFLLLMLPVHVPIGLVEGFATAAILLFVQRAQPDLVAPSGASPAGGSMKPLLASLAIAATVTAGAVSWLASKAPDGLEWSIEQVATTAEMPAPATDVHAFLGRLQEQMSFLPDDQLPGRSPAAREPAEPAWPQVDAGTSIAGLVGGAVTLLLVGLIAALLRRQRR